MTVTAQRLLDAAASCIKCGKPHPRRTVRDFRGNLTTSVYARGHMPVLARQYDGPALLAALSALLTTLEPEPRESPAASAERPAAARTARPRATGAPKRTATTKSTRTAK